MQIKHGSTRVAIIMFGVAFKFPKLQQATSLGKTFCFLRGVHANITEFATYILCGRPRYMAAVFSLGFVNLQRYIPSDVPSWDERADFINSMSEDARKIIQFMDPHYFTPSNFRKTSNGVCMIDFGDKYADGFPLSYFLHRHHTEFGNALMPRYNKTATNV